MARCAIALEYLLCEHRASLAAPDGHDSHLHVEQLGKTLGTLRGVYAEIRSASAADADADEVASSDSSDLLTDREAEHAAYQILLKLDDHGPFKRASGVVFLRDARATPPEVLTHPKVQARSSITLVPIRPRRRGERRSLRTLSPGVSLRPSPLAFNPDTPRRLSTPLLTPLNSTPTFIRSYGPSTPQFALRIKIAYEAGNVVEFFRLTRSKRCTYLQACCAFKYFDKIRVRALEALVSSSAKGATMKAATLARDVLRFTANGGGGGGGGGDDDASASAAAIDLARRCGLEVSEDDVVRLKPDASGGALAAGEEKRAFAFRAPTTTDDGGRVRRVPSHTGPHTTASAW